METGERPHRVGDLGAGTCRRRCPAAPTTPSVPEVCGDGQVELAVAVEVARHDGRMVRSRRVADLGLEGAVAVAQQHRYCRHRSSADGQVEPAVAVEVARHQDRMERRSHRVLVSGSWKVPSPLPSSTDDAVGVELATARSSRPSPLKSPATSADGTEPHRVVDLGSGRCRRRCPAAPRRRRSRRWRRPGRAAVAVEVARHDG